MWQMLIPSDPYGIYYLLKWLVYWPGRLVIGLFYGKRIEFEPFGDTENPGYEMMRAVECRKRGRIFVSDGLCVILGMLVWIAVGLGAWLIWSRFHVAPAAGFPWTSGHTLVVFMAVAFLALMMCLGRPVRGGKAKLEQVHDPVWIVRRLVFMRRARRVTLVLLPVSIAMFFVTGLLTARHMSPPLATAVTIVSFVAMPVSFVLFLGAMGMSCPRCRKPFDVDVKTQKSGDGKACANCGLRLDGSCDVPLEPAPYGPTRRR